MRLHSLERSGSWHDYLPHLGTATHSVPGATDLAFSAHYTVEVARISVRCVRVPFMKKMHMLRDLQCRPIHCISFCCFETGSAR